MRVRVRGAIVRSESGGRRRGVGRLTGSQCPKPTPALSKRCPKRLRFISARDQQPLCWYYPPSLPNRDLSSRTQLTTHDTINRDLMVAFFMICMFKPLNRGTLSCWAKHAKHGLSWGRAIIFKSLSTVYSRLRLVPRIATIR